MPDKGHLIRLMGLGVILWLFAASATHAGWSAPVRISEPGGGYNPQIIAQGDTLHSIFTLTTAREGACYLRSSDGGHTWDRQKILSDTINTGPAWYPRIMANGNRLMALWEVYISHPVYHYNIAYSMSTNNGLTWNSPQYVLSNNRQWGFPMAALFSGPIVNIMAECSVINDTVYYSNIRSTNFGQSWSAPREIFRALQSGVPDQAEFGNFVHFVWDGCYHNGDPWEIYYLKSTDGGISWSQSTMISTQDNHGSDSPSIYCDTFNNMQICWDDGKYSPYMLTGDILTRGSRDSGNTWGPERQATFNHFALGANDIALNGDTIHLVWEDASQGLGHRSIYYTKSTDDGESWSEPYWIDGTLDDSADPAMAVSNGRVYVVWADGRVNPDTSLRSGLYISRYDPDNDAVNDENINNFPKKVSLSAYPNPFNSSITITYSNLKGSEIGIYDIQGKLIRTLKTDGGENGKIISYGSVGWDATDALGNKVSSGIYFAKVIKNDNSKYIKLVYLK